MGPKTQSEYDRLLEAAREAESLGDWTWALECRTKAEALRQKTEHEGDE